MLNLYVELAIVCTLIVIVFVGREKFMKDVIEAEDKTKFLLRNGFFRSCLLAVILLFVFDDPAILGLSVNFNWINFFLGLGIGSALLMLSVGFLSFVWRKLPGKLRRTTTAEERERLKAIMKLYAPKNALELVVFIIYGCFFLAGFSEEIIFRGFLQNHLKNITGSLNTAVLLQAVIFGVGHRYLRLKEMVNATIVGIIMSFVYVYSGTLLSAILMHFLIDSITTIEHYNARRKGQLDKVIDRILGQEFC